MTTSHYHRPCDSPLCESDNIYICLYATITCYLNILTITIHCTENSTSKKTNLCILSVKQMYNKITYLSNAHGNCKLLHNELNVGMYSQCSGSCCRSAAVCGILHDPPSQWFPCPTASSADCWHPCTSVLLLFELPRVYCLAVEATCTLWTCVTTHSDRH